MLSKAYFEAKQDYSTRKYCTRKVKVVKQSFSINQLINQSIDKASFNKSIDRVINHLIKSYR